MVSSGISSIISEIKNVENCKNKSVTGTFTTYKLASMGTVHEYIENTESEKQHQKFKFNLRLLTVFSNN
jgi:hypothetical protein